jgi:hypothetical protein
MSNYFFGPPMLLAKNIGNSDQKQHYLIKNGKNRMTKKLQQTG